MAKTADSAFSNAPPQNEVRFLALFSVPLSDQILSVTLFSEALNASSRSCADGSGFWYRAKVAHGPQNEIGNKLLSQALFLVVLFF